VAYGREEEQQRGMKVILVHVIPDPAKVLELFPIALSDDAQRQMAVDGQVARVHISTQGLGARCARPAGDCGHRLLRNLAPIEPVPAVLASCVALNVVHISSGLDVG
jgi:hypothetical protein